MIEAGDFRPGMVVELEGELYSVVEFQHVKRGRGTAYVWTKVRNLKTGATVEKTFMPQERYPRAFLDRKPMQYLYHDGGGYVFMDQETFDQVALGEDLLGGAVQYLRDGTVVTVVLHEGRAIGVEFPTSVELEVVETPPGVRGDTAQGGTKPARLETGVVVQVPLFVDAGDRIRVDTRTGQYLERVK